MISNLSDASVENDRFPYDVRSEQKTTSIRPGTARLGVGCMLPR